MRNQLFKYKIGLGVLGLLSLVLLVMVVMQGSAVKQDRETFEKADKVANKLDQYVTSWRTPPRSLAAAGIRDVPKEVSYRKLSSERYEFCVTYKSESSGFDAQQIQSDLLTGGAYSRYSSRSSGQEPTYLLLSPNHKKGKNCQTVRSSSSYYDNFDVNSTDFNTQSF